MHPYIYCEMKNIAYMEMVIISWFSAYFNKNRKAPWKK